MLTHEQIIELTREYGGEWGVMYADKRVREADDLPHLFDEETFGPSQRRVLGVGC